MNDTLSVDGARLLCGARENILAHPETFDMGEWDCGSRACIAGHIARQIARLRRDGWSTADVSAALGFGHRLVVPHGHPLSALFFEDVMSGDAVLAAARITEFLWQYGFAGNGERLEAACIG